jgi:hypothetical protein
VAQPQKKEGVVKIGNKEYHTVAKRVNDFRKDKKFEGWAIITDCKVMDEMKVIMLATILDANDRVVATGHAEEFRASSKVNRTSALENAETSAIGRALACIGIGGTEFASANEVQGAMAQQNTLASPEQVAALNQLLEQNVISKGQLLSAFGHQDPARLFSVEADRILTAVATATSGEEK